ncbi:hypothetical protein Lalb_Chr15g0082871 [Lupinus albus]|uniref:Uncharacterized protein n=1 Tax=Lupinus albus TaxID=3870 RepID=A0A6A4NYF1_LUPAL|nr:hypothetical protein Lalb_Chr15g0082871 [Lupinus albus]
MARPSLLFPCLVVLFLIASGSGFVEANTCRSCSSDGDCEKIPCHSAHCFKTCTQERCCACSCVPPHLIPSSNKI